MARALLAAVLLPLALTGTALAAPIAYTTPNDELVLADTGAPGSVLERHAITGLQPGEHIRGIDVRPATGALYGLGIVSAASDTARLYTIDPGTGAATQVGSTPFKTDFIGSEYGFDVNPVSDLIRVVNRADQNVRVNPNNGALVGNDSNLNPAGDVDAIAYDQNNAGTTQTTLWGYDSGVDKFVRIGGVNGGPPDGSPNAGKVVSPFGGGSGITNLGRAGMDIAPNGVAFLSARPTASGSSALYAVNLSMGTVSLLGSFSEVVDDIARLQVSGFAFDGSSIAVGEDAGLVSVTVLRFGDATGTQSVAFATADGTASAASDYNTSTGVLNFAPGETSRTFAVPVIDDGADEPAETIALSLSAPSGGARLTTPETATLTILDDDLPPFVLPPDTTKPTLLVTAPSPVRATRLLRRGVSGRFSTSEACSLVFELKLGTRTIGQSTVSPTGASAQRFSLTLTSSGKRALRKALKRRRSVRLKLVATGTDPAGNAGTASARLRARRR